MNAYKARPIWFLAAVLFAISGIWSLGHHDRVASISTFAIALLMAAVGFSTRPNTTACEPENRTSS